MTNELPFERLGRHLSLDRIAPQTMRDSLALLLTRHSESLIAKWRREQDLHLYSNSAGEGADAVAYGFSACIQLLTRGTLPEIDGLLSRFRAPGESPADTAARLHHVFSTMCHALAPIVLDEWADSPRKQERAITLLLAIMDIGVGHVCCALEQAVEAHAHRAEGQHLHCLEELARLVTGDALRIVPEEHIPSPQGQVFSIIDPADGVHLRRAVTAAAVEIGMASPRVDDLSLAVGEAVSNVIKHAGEGTAYVWQDNETVYVRVSDTGSGISVENLPKVVSPGWSSEISLGMGFTLMLEMSDALWMSSGPEGTTLCIEKSVDSPPTASNGDMHPAATRFLSL